MGMGNGGRSGGGRMIQPGNKNMPPGNFTTTHFIPSTSNVNYLSGVNITDKNLTPQQKHQEEQLATICTMQQLLSPENAQGGIVYLMGPGSGGSLCPTGPGNQGMMKMPQKQQQQHGMMPDGQMSQQLTESSRTWTAHVFDASTFHDDDGRTQRNGGARWSNRQSSSLRYFFVLTFVWHQSTREKKISRLGQEFGVANDV